MRSKKIKNGSKNKKNILFRKTFKVKKLNSRKRKTKQNKRKRRKVKSRKKRGGMFAAFQRGMDAAASIIAPDPVDILIDHLNRESDVKKTQQQQLIDRQISNPDDSEVHQKLKLVMADQTRISNKLHFAEFIKNNYVEMQKEKQKWLRQGKQGKGRGSYWYCMAVHFRPSEGGIFKHAGKISDRLSTLKQCPQDYDNLIENAEAQETEAQNLLRFYLAQQEWGNETIHNEYISAYNEVVKNIFQDSRGGEDYFTMTGLSNEELREIKEQLSSYVNEEQEGVDIQEASQESGYFSPSSSVSPPSSPIAKSATIPREDEIEVI